MLSNITVPLLGLVDSAILGHLPDAVYLGAVAIGAQLFTLLCWSFGFLRMGTTALTARSHNDAGQQQVLFNAIWLSLPLALLVMLAGAVLFPLVIPWMGASAEVSSGAREYLAIRMYSIPAVLLQYGLLGWFIGRGQTRVPLLIMTITNLVNGGLDALFVFGLGMTVDGVALGSVMADYSGTLLGLAFALKACNVRLGQLLPQHWLVIWQRRPAFEQLKPVIKVNHQLFVRTLTLLLVFAFFNAQGAQQSELILATNSLIITLLMLISNALDGIAHAAESLTGQSLASRSREPDNHHHLLQVRSTLLLTGVNSLTLALLLTLVFALGADQIWPLLTNNVQLLPVLADYQHWLIWLPLIGCWSYWLDGLCIGAGATATMRNAMLAATLLVFLPLWWFTRELQNTGLWLSFYAFLLARGVFVIPFTIRLYKQPDIFAPAV
nr:MATE family efflux transporter [Oceanobacter mangrovi]